MKTVEPQASTDNLKTEWITIPVTFKDMTPDPTEEDGYYDGCDEDFEEDQSLAIAKL